MMLGGLEIYIHSFFNCVNRVIGIISPPENELTLPFEYEVGWFPEQVWTFRRKEKSLFLVESNINFYV
jgi:hypothetical protein